MRCEQIVWVFSKLCNSSVFTTIEIIKPVHRFFVILVGKFCSGKILNVEVVDGGLICSSGVVVEDMGDKNDDCYIVNAAVYIGY